MPPTPSSELAIRIIVEDPLPGVALALQRGRDAIDPPATTDQSVASPAEGTVFLNGVLEGTQLLTARLQPPIP